MSRCAHGKDPKFCWNCDGHKKAGFTRVRTEYSGGLAWFKNHEQNKADKKRGRR